MKYSRASRVLVTALLATTLSGASLAVSQTSAQAASCTKQTGTTKTDPNTGWKWSTWWICGNTAGAPLYADAKLKSGSSRVGVTLTGHMNSTNSWFVCWRKGSLHAGGNNIWYYTQGDVAENVTSRKAWGYMPAFNLTTSVDPQPGMAQCPVGQSPPAPTSGLSKPVFFVHGYSIDGTGFNAKGSLWADAIDDYYYDGTPAKQTGRIWTYCYYSTDTNCDLKTTGDRSQSIETVAQDLAWTIFDGYSRYGEAVDAVGHSMGGLIIAAAITGTAKHASGFPPYLYIEDVSTLSTPFDGVPTASMLQWLGGACTFTQCKEMSSGSPFLSWLYPNPQSDMYTDWTVIGADDDIFVPAWSSAPEDKPFNHKVIYGGGQILPKIYAHASIVDEVSGTWNYSYCDYNSSGCSLSDRTTWFQVNGGGNDPIRMARWGNYSPSW